MSTDAIAGRRLETSEIRQLIARPEPPRKPAPIIEAIAAALSGCEDMSTWRAQG